MFWIVLAFLIIAADQIVKWFIAANAPLMETFVNIFDIFEICYVKNTGAAFSIMSGKMSFLSVVSVAFCIGVIIYWLKTKPTNKLFCTSLCLMFAGAFGNAIDRIFRGFVVDYINISLFTFPVFNIADIAITVGAVLMMVYVIFFDKSK